MTPARTHYGMPVPAPVPVFEEAEGHGPRVCDDMTVEVALAVMAGARVEYLTVCDGDDQSTGSVSQVRLAVLRDSSAYTDRIRLRDVLDGSPGARPMGQVITRRDARDFTADEVTRAMSRRGLTCHGGAVAV